MSTLQRDFKAQAFSHSKNNKRKRHSLLILAGILVGIGIALSLMPLNATALRNASTTNVAGKEITATNAAPVSLPLPKYHEDNSTIVDSKNRPSAIQQGQWHTITVKRGNTLSSVFDRLNLSQQQLQDILALGSETKVLKRLFPGDTLNVYINDQQQLLGLNYDIDETHTLHIAQGSNGLVSQTIEKIVERRVTHATGIINDSLFLTAQRAGLSDNLTMELASIFGWDIDFALDIRQGDSFSVVFEELYQHGEKLRNGNILAAEFVNRNHSYRAIRYTDASKRTDYYSPDGKSMRKAFLRTPVDFSRISSRYNSHRKHPVLNKIRAHKGVDYAAARGTPVKATGDGKIIFHGVKGGYGKTVIIQHGSSYNTLYAHLKGYARGIRNGKRVRQGQIIGYIGSTGLATGPHLHYEFRVHGKHRNPLTVRLPAATPLPKKYRTDFKQVIQPYLAQLDTLKRTVLALQDQ